MFNVFLERKKIYNNHNHTMTSYPIVIFVEISSRGRPAPAAVERRWSIFRRRRCGCRCSGSTWSQVLVRRSDPSGAVPQHGGHPEALDNDKSRICQLQQQMVALYYNERDSCQPSILRRTCQKTQRLCSPAVRASAGRG